MVYNNNQNIDESSGKMDDPAQNMGESIQDVDKSAANQKRDESGRGMTEPEPNQIKAASESDQDMDEDEDIDIGFHFEDTSNIDVPKLLIDQVLGQEHAVEVVKKAASQRRHIMMIGTPGTGKSLLAKAMAELLPKEELKDILVYPNMEDLNNPKIREVPAGKGREIVMAHKMEARKKAQARNMLMMLFVVGIIIYSYFVAQLLWGIIAGIIKKP
jgi:Lon-like ATP-dependent protease